MARRKHDFQEADKIKLLLWCDRHCCLCGKACGTDIEIAHIDEKGAGVIDNAIPLCYYDCHAKIGHYNPKHPKGNKHKPDELKTRREQVYEQHTRTLVPPIDYRITQQLGNGALRELPGTLEARVTVTVVDQYERHHKLLPFSWIFNPPAKDWYAHPDPRH